MTDSAEKTRPADNVERRSTLETQVATNPKLLDTITARIAAGDYPKALLGALPDAALDNAHAARSPLESLVSTAPIAALEAIVKLTGRPPMLVRDDAVVMEPLPDFQPGTDLKIVSVQKWLPSVGRIEFLNADSSWGGTGSVVDKRGADLLVLTNRHVAKLVAQRAADGRGVFIRNWQGVRMGAEVDFREEADSRAGDRSRTATVTAIDYLADDLAADIALLRIAPGAYAPPAVFNMAAKDAGFNDLVALVGYPAFDPRNNAGAQAKYFHDIYNVKRFAPGFVTQVTSGASYLSHDCTSLGGNSGSPLINLDTGQLIGLHYAGEYLKANSAVSITTIKKVLSGAFTTVQVPGGVPGREGVAERRRDESHDAAHFTGREGFATAFLKKGTVATPWPGLNAALDATLALPSDTPAERGELRYTHFGVKYSATDKVPLMTAVNIDGGRSKRIKRGDDQWFFDGRIPRAIQLDAANFADPEIDRGHMVRREDPNWGTAEEAEQANADTFHYVNAAAQHARLNQSQHLWQGLENYILDSSRTGGFRASVFTGPVIGPDDPVIDGARVPLEYWKLVATLDESKQHLRATAYLLSQGQMIRDLLERRSRVEALEGITLGAYRTFQIAIADLAEATGYDFSAYLAADPLRRTDESVAGAAQAEPRFIAIENLSSIVL
ncbi:DNA/RNA non-specific endonuclease [Sphingobium sufflavum]|uniref:DNA/RNA non-specific endonuclease n=1 Tax=Sphingobium sufflavum TaxID=1129547 RepID=UPI001F46D79D|nr:DNA/RNA non-specific endonuclease [Sphingobium sufflavum]MCE7796379.1 DNA/RNA non-specific endonuclease [Sphingobium sufflavum]